MVKKPIKKTKPSRHARRMQKLTQKTKTQIAKDKLAISKAKSKAERAEHEYAAKATKRYGSNDAKFLSKKREEELKTKEDNKRKFGDAVAWNMKYGQAFNSINNTIDSIFDYRGWDAVSEDNTNESWGKHK